MAEGFQELHAAARPSHEAIAALQARLAPLLGDRLTANAAVREHHGRGEAMREVSAPDLVVFAETTEEVAAVLAACDALRVPVIPFGAGTSLEGHVSALHGGLCLDLTRMNRVLTVSPEDLDCRVQAGVTRLQLNAELRDQGLFFPIDPGADATIGGMSSTRASGTNAVRYGTMREAVLGLTVVTPNGRIIRTGGRARKSSAGYDLTRLFIGAEGTLGVITEIQLRLHGVPEVVASATCQFDDLERAIGVVILAMQLALPLARIEFLDEIQMRACIRYSHLEGLEEKPTLFLEFHGGPKAVEEQVEQMRALCAAGGGTEFRWADKAEDRNRLWKARHDAYYAALALIPGKEAYATDSCVPISELAACIAGVRGLIEESGLTAPIVGHVGDGNFHVVVLHDRTDPDELRRADELSEKVGRLAIAHGGTCTGEHGVGMHKLGLLVEEHGEAVDIMRDIKRALDPNVIMNPGKVLGPATVY